ncbi:MAG: hypothetical protein KDE58_39195, partial [Caldilineaceae bacterium]|nr:hypothetical protein [Caldilineaceae bacterium]
MATADQQANTANATPQPPLDPSAMTIDKEQVQRDLEKIEAAPLVTPEEDPDAAATIPGGATQEISQDWALFRLLGGALRPYRGWMTLSLLLMLVVAGLNVVPPYLLQQAIDGPIAQGNSTALWRIAL